MREINFLKEVILKLTNQLEILELRKLCKEFISFKTTKKELPSSNLLIKTDTLYHKYDHCIKSSTLLLFTAKWSRQAKCHHFCFNVIFIIIEYFIFICLFLFMWVLLFLFLLFLLFFCKGIFLKFGPLFILMWCCCTFLHLS